MRTVSLVLACLVLTTLYAFSGRPPRAWWLLLAAIMGVTIPLLMQKLGRDPAVGSSVMITAITDSGGFFIFLGLATIFLI